MIIAKAISIIDQKNIEFYTHYAHLFEKIPSPEIIIPLFEKYASDAPGKAVIDIGAGTGCFAQWISNQGFSVLCLDITPEMIERCKQKGLATHLGSIQEFQSCQSFDVALALASLIHLRKQEVAPAIQKIAELLNDKGIFIVAVLQGTYEGFEPVPSNQLERYYSAFTQQEIEEMAVPHFTILEMVCKEVKSMNKEFLIYVLQKKII